MNHRAGQKEMLTEAFSIRHRITNGADIHTSHMHDELEVMLVLRGSPTVTVNGVTFQVQDGTMLLFNPTDMHIIVPRGAVFDRYVLYFRSDFLNVLSSDSARLLECFYVKDPESPNRLVLTPEETQEFVQLFDQIAAIQQEPELLFGKELEQRYRVGLALIRINRLAAKNTALAPARRRKNAQQLADIMDYIRQNIDGDLSLKTLAAAHYMDKNRLCRLFSESLGVSPGQYVIKARIAAAQQLLMQGESIDRVCGRCGFNSLAHFSRTFRAHTGEPPSRFAGRRLGKDGSVEHFPVEQDT